MNSRYVVEQATFDVMDATKRQQRFTLFIFLLNGTEIISQASGCHGKDISVLGSWTLREPMNENVGRTRWQVHSHVVRRISNGNLLFSLASSEILFVIRILDKCLLLRGHVDCRFETRLGWPQQTNGTEMPSTYPHAYQPLPIVTRTGQRQS